MKTKNNMIELTDKEARITNIEKTKDTTTAMLEWGGPDQRAMSDFNCDLLGDVLDVGNNIRSAGGWVVLNGPCLLKEGDTIPYIPGEK